MSSPSIKKTFRPTLDVLDSRCSPSSLGIGRPHSFGEFEHAHLRRHHGGDRQIEVQHQHEVEHQQEVEAETEAESHDTGLDT